MAVSPETQASPAYTPPEDGAYMDDKAVQALFGDSISIVNEGTGESDIPEEIKQVIEENQLGTKKSFRVVLREMPEGCTEHESAFVIAWKNSIPTTEWIAKNYGPGKYLLMFHWDVWTTVDGKRKRQSNTEKTDVLISEKFRTMYRNFQMQKRLKDAKDMKDLLKDAQMENFVEDTFKVPGVEVKPEKPVDPKAYVKEMIDFASSVGLTQKKSIDWGVILPAVLSALPMVVKYLDDKSARERERQEKFMLMMMNNTQANSNTLVELVKNQHGPTSYSQTLEEVSKMLFGALDLKEALSGKESSVDKIFGMIERFAPLILTFAAMPKQQRVAQPGYAAAQAFINSDPKFQEMMSSPEKQVSLIRKLDAFYGWQQTNQILSVMEINRPPECPTLPEQEYPAGDPRNSGEPDDEDMQEEQTAGEVS